MGLKHEQPVSSGAPVAARARAIRPALFYLIAVLVFIGDQLSKAWVQHALAWEQSRPIFGHVFQLTLTHNTGGAWGLLPQGNLLFIIFASIAIVALLYAYHRMPHVPLLVGTALALALGGALGNLLDRLRYQYVVDFFHFQVGQFQWPIFNIADSAITLGIGLLLLHFLRTAHAESDPAHHPVDSHRSLAAEEAGSHQSEA